MPSSLDQKLSHLTDLVAKLRSTKGCPWDIEQTHESLIPYLIDEAYELAEVLNENPKQDWKIKDELGDCLYQVIIHAQIASETGRFDLSDVIDSISQKIQRRHPHVFGGKGPWSKDEVMRQWDAIKQEEKRSQPMDLHPRPKDPYFKFERSWTSLQDSSAIGEKAKTFGFDWSSWEQVFEKVSEELLEVKEACEARTSNQNHVEEEIGDLLFAICQLARSRNIDAEKALKSANQKFRNRFQAMLNQLSLQLKNSEQNVPNSGLLAEFIKLSPEEKENLWRLIKIK